MAGIDKTYCSSYEDYKAFKDWADNQVVTFFDGHKERVGDWVWHYGEEDFEVEIFEGLTFYIGDDYCRVSTIFEDKKIATIVSFDKPDVAKTQLDFNTIIKLAKESKKLPIMNTPIWLDIYLIQNCKSEFVIERMKRVYGKYFEKYKKLKDLTKVPDGYAKNRKIVIKNSDNCKFPFKKKMFRKPIGGKMSWWVQCDDISWGYNDETKTWANGKTYYPTNTNTSLIGSYKGVVRHLRKQYLPKGIEFTISGRYVGEEYQILIK